MKTRTQLFDRLAPLMTLFDWPVLPNTIREAPARTRLESPAQQNPQEQRGSLKNAVMKKHLCLIGLLFGLLQFAAFARVAGTYDIAPGESTTNSIAASYQIDYYSFQANKGDKLLARMQVLSGQMHARVGIYRLDGTQLTYNYGTSYTSVDWTCPADGAYLLWASDYLTASGTGTYLLNLQRLNNPENPQLSLFGQNVTNTIGQAFQMNAHSFVAQAGDKLLVRMQVLSGQMHARVGIYKLDGTPLNYSNGGSYTSLDWTCPADGAYLLWASDYLTGAGTGTYLVRLEGPLGPRIFRQPQSVKTSTGATAIFGVLVSGNEPLQYQWRLKERDLSNTDRISGANSTTLTISQVRQSDAGAYSVAVSNLFGKTTSANADLVQNSVKALFWPGGTRRSNSRNRSPDCGDAARASRTSRAAPSLVFRESCQLRPLRNWGGWPPVTPTGAPIESGVFAPCHRGVGVPLGSPVPGLWQ